jgi:C-terminal processing protease CtpA/Prc
MVIVIMTSCISQAQNTSEKNQLTKPISAILADNNSLPISERIDLYHKLKKENPNAPNLEEKMNMYGYNLLWDGKEMEALEIFKLLVDEFPNSANTYDSLAEVYLRTGNKEQALINYEKAVSMDPDNFNAEDQIESIKYPDKKKLTSQEKFHKVYSVQEYKDDLDQLNETIARVHPNALKFITQEELNNLIEAKKALITDKTTYAEFAWHCSAIVASINCSHSNTDRFWQENQMIPMEARFPLQTRLVQDRLFVIDPLNNEDLVSVKDEIISINGIDIKSLTQKIYPHISSQGFIQTTKRHEFNMWSTGMIAYGLGLPGEYTIQVKGKEKPILLNKAENHNDPKRDKSQEYCGGDLCLEYLDIEKKIASMTISSFNYYEWNNFDVFEKFINVSMNEMNKYGTEQLIIDLRGNGGGSPESSIHLLKYLIHEPFVYYSKAEFKGKTEKIEGEKEQLPFENGFNGKLHFIIDGKGNSTTGHFMSLVKDRELGVIVGEELGSNQFCSADRKRCRLSNTKLQYNLAVNTHISTATSLPDEVGILPDHYVNQSIDDYIDGKDAIKQYTIDLIGKQIKWEPASKYLSSYFLEANPEWSKELFQIPLNFAPDVSLRGIEDARFTPGWREKEGDTFWSYVFGWNVNHTQPLSIDEMSRNLELYFNGLMRVKERGKEYGMTESKASFIEIESTTNTLKYTGQIKTLDGFFERKPMTFNVKVEQQFCEEIQRAVLIFRFSPQSFDSDVWNKLETVKFPQNICDK